MRRRTHTDAASSVSDAEVRSQLIVEGLLVPAARVPDRVGAGKPCLALDKEGRKEAARAIKRGPIREWRR